MFLQICMEKDEAYFMYYVPQKELMCAMIYIEEIVHTPCYSVSLHQQC